MTSKYEQVPVEKLRWHCDPSQLSFHSTEEIDTVPTILGQERAVRALKLGLEMRFPGYNVYVSGATGTGKTTTVKFLLKDRQDDDHTPNDICYVNNFQNPDKPVSLSLPAGQGTRFKKEMESMIEHLQATISHVFEGEKYRNQRELLIEKYNALQKGQLEKLEAKARQLNFTMVQIQLGPYTKPDVLPVIGDAPVPIESLPALIQQGKLTAEEADKMVKLHEQLAKDLAAAFKANQKLQREKKLKLAELDREIVRPIIEEHIAEIDEEFKNKGITDYLNAVQESLLGNLDLFRGKPEPEEQHAKKTTARALVVDPFLEYRVNVIVDNSNQKGAPVVFETSPSYAKLFGTVDRVMDGNGQWRTDFTKIRAGSLLMANGGYLVLYALDVLVETGVWNNLKRTLKTRKTEIHGYDPYFMIAFSSIKPEPIDIDVKVIMIGDANLYRILYHADEDFKKIFKIKADFDSEMKNEMSNLYRYAEFIKWICDEEKLLHFDKSGVAAVAEYGVRLAGRQNKISTRFNYIADLLREASHYAKKDNAKLVLAKHVELAIQEGCNRLNLVEEKIQEMIEDGTIMVDTDGAKVGQVNGLSVLSLGDYTFGQPSRITAQVSMGRSGIINIEREAELSGPTHNKGVLILTGYLQGRFAQEKPLSISASLCFEQSYSEVDGDSASSAEVYALLSALSQVPIRQDLAVTGSVNQRGEIQPIGGVNEKIEGFFKVCQAKGLTGTQGVLIPRLNVKDLMLKNEVVDQVRKGRFHVYPVDTIDQGIEILTGVPAGKQDENRQYPKESVFGLVDARLSEFAEKLRHFANPTV